MEVLKNKFKYLRYFIVIVCIYIIYQNFDQNSQAVQNIKDFSIASILSLFLFIGLTIFFYSQIIYKTIISIASSKVTYLTWFVIFLNSQVLNVIPFLGFAYRAVKLKKYDVSYEKYISIYYSLIWLFLLYFFLMYSIEISLFISPYFYIKKIPVVAVLLLLVIFGSIAPFLILKYLPNNPRILNKFLSWIYSKSKNIVYESTLNIKKPNYIKNFLLFAFLIHILEFLIIYMTFKGLGIAIAFKWVVLFFIINNLSSMFQISPGNIGISELTMGVAGIPLGLDFTTSVTIRLLIRMMHLTFVCIAVLLLNLILKIFFRKIKI